MKAALFVDVSNLYYNARKVFDGKVNYATYCSCIDQVDILHMNAYGTTHKINDKFLGTLARLKFTLYFKEATDKIKHWDWNVQMAMDLARVGDKLDVVYFGTSNPAILPMLIYCRERGIRTCIYSIRIPRILKDNADEYKEVEKGAIIFNESRPIDNSTQSLELPSISDGDVSE